MLKECCDQNVGTASPEQGCAAQGAMCRQMAGSVLVLWEVTGGLTQDVNMIACLARWCRWDGLTCQTAVYWTMWLLRRTRDLPAARVPRALSLLLFTSLHCALPRVLASLRKPVSERDEVRYPASSPQFLCRKPCGRGNLLAVVNQLSHLWQLACCWCNFLARLKHLADLANSVCTPLLGRSVLRCRFK